MLESNKVGKRNWGRIIVIGCIMAWMATYTIYMSYYRANAVEQYERHMAHVAGESMFFNPWQYRVLCPMIVEVIYQGLDATLFNIIEIKGVHLNLPGDAGNKNDVTQKLMENFRNPEFIKYTIVFVGFRFLLNVFVFWLAYQYFLCFVRNKYLVWISVMLTALFMGNSVVDSDLTLNTYMDIAVYLLAGLVIVKNYSYWWIVPITIVGALNRETSVLIPALFFFAKISWDNWKNIRHFLTKNSAVISVSVISTLLFIAIFVSIRAYYGYQPQSTWRVAAGWPMLKLNLFSAVSVKTYMELFGVFGFLPLWCIAIYKTMDSHLKIFFMVVVPVWFAIHLGAAIGYQTRLFLVPTLLVFIPAVFAYVENAIIANRQTMK